MTQVIFINNMELIEVILFNEYKSSDNDSSYLYWSCIVEYTITLQSHKYSSKMT